MRPPTLYLMAYQQKTHPTDVPPEEFLDAAPTERRRTEGHALLDLFRAATGAPAVMWGPTMVGFGEYSHVYDSGHGGTYFRLGFSPRKAAISLYGLQGFPRSDELLAKLGPRRTGAGCVYVTNLAKVDTGVLRELVEHAWAHETTAC